MIRNVTAMLLLISLALPGLARAQSSAKCPSELSGHIACRMFVLPTEWEWQDADEIASVQILLASLDSPKGARALLDSMDSDLRQGGWVMLRIRDHDPDVPYSYSAVYRGDDSTILTSYFTVHDHWIVSVSELGPFHLSSADAISIAQNVFTKLPTTSGALLDALPDEDELPFQATLVDEREVGGPTATPAADSRRYSAWSRSGLYEKSA